MNPSRETRIISEFYSPCKLGKNAAPEVEVTRCLIRVIPLTVTWRKLCKLFKLSHHSSPRALVCRAFSVASGTTLLGFPGGKEPACQCRRHKRRGFNPWVGRIPWRKKWEPTPVFCLENSMNRGAWQAMVHGVAKKSDMTQLLNNKMYMCVCVYKYIYSYSFSDSFPF